LIVAYAAGCAEEGPEGASLPDGLHVVGEPPVEGTPPPDPGAPVELTATLTETNDSGLTGTATAVDSDGVVVIVVEAAGVPAPGEYPAQLHSGTCSFPGDPLVALNPVIGLADGTGESATTLSTEEVRLEGPLSVRIQGPGGVVLSCGELGPPTR
jgi:hypothetical protein